MKLKKCPFCGERPRTKIALTGSGKRRRFVICICKVMQYREIPYKYWNERSPNA